MTSIAFIHPFFYRYYRGIERATAQLSSVMVRQGISVDLLTWRWPKPIAWPGMDSRVKIRLMPTSRYYASLFVIPFYAACLMQNRYDHILIYFADYGEAQAINLLHKLGKDQKFSIVLQSPYSQVPHRYISFKKSGLAARAYRIIAVSRFVAGEAENFFQRPCVVAPNGVDTNLFRPRPEERNTVRRELGLPEDAPLILTASALEERKGVQWMIKAMPEVLRSVPGAYYVVCGDGPYKESLRQVAESCNVTHRVCFLPARSDIQRFYQAADVMVLLSKEEAFPLVSVEAMASGLPLVVSNHPPYDEIIVSGNGQNGQQVDETDSHQVAEVVISYIKDKHLGSQVGANGRKLSERFYSWEQITKLYLSEMFQE